MIDFPPVDKPRYCECEHPDSAHDSAGCTWLIPDQDGVDWTCSCTKFEEALGDTNESLGVDVL